MRPTHVGRMLYNLQQVRASLLLVFFRPHGADQLGWFYLENIDVFISRKRQEETFRYYCKGAGDVQPRTTSETYRTLPVPSRCFRHSQH